MADDILVIGSEFNPAGIIRGVDLAGNSLQEFEKIVRRIDQQTGKALDISALGTVSAKAWRDAAAAAAIYESRIKDVLVTSGALSAIPLGPVAPPNIIRDKVAQLKILADRHQEVGASAAIAARHIHSMNVSLLEGAGRRGGGAQMGPSDQSSWNRGLANLAGTSNAAAQSFAKSNRAANLMRGSLVTLAAQSVQTSSALGGLAQSAIFFAGGQVGVIAVAGAVLAAVKAWEFYTKEQRASALATEENRKALQALQEQQKGPVVQAGEVFAKQLKEVDRLRRSVADLSAAVQAAQADIGRVGSGVPLLEKAGALSEQLREQTTRTKDLTAAKLELVAAERAAAEASTATFNAALQFQRQQQDLVISALSAAPGLGTDTAATQRETRAEMARLSAIMRDQNVSLVERNEVARQFNQLQEASRFHIKEAEALQRGETEAIEASAAAAAAFLAMLDRINTAQAAVIATRNAAQAKRFGQTGLTEGIDFAFEQAKSRTDLIEDPRVIALDKLVIGFKQARAEAELFAEAEKRARTEGERLAAALFDMGSLAFGLADVGRSLGLIGEEAQRSLGAVGSLFDALAQPTSFASVLGAITASAGVLGSIFGESATAREHAGIIDRNTKALEDATFAYLQGVGGVTKGQAALAGLQGLPPGVLDSILKTAGSDIALFGRVGTDLFNAELEKLGSSLAELSAIAGLNGIQLLDERGNLVADALAQLKTALEFAAKAAKELADDQAARDATAAAEDAARALAAAAEEAAQALRDAAQRFQDAFPTLLDLRSQLLGQTDPADIFANALTGLAFTAPDLAQMFTGFNLDDSASREALRQQVLGVVEQMLGGQLGVEQLGITPEEFGPLLDFLGIAADSLDRFNESVNDATKSLLNMPTGINLAAHEFRAQAAGGFEVPTPFTPQRQPGLELGDARPFRGTDGAQLPMVDQRHVGDINIVVQGGTNVSPEEAARRIKEALKRESMARTGSPDNWGR